MTKVKLFNLKDLKIKLHKCKLIAKVSKELEKTTDKL